MPGPKILLPLTFVLAIAAVAILYCQTWQPNRQKNGFRRILTPLILERQTLLAQPAVISGQDRGSVYLYTGRANTLLKVNTEDLSIGQVKLAFPQPQKLIQTFISDSEISVLERNTGQIAHFNSAGALLGFDTIPFSISKGCRMAKEVYMFKTVDTATMRPNLVIFDHGNKKSWPLSKWAGANQDYFSQDGFLIADPDSLRGCYVFYYHNTIIRVDANGNIDRIIRTIDTIQTTAVKGHMANDEGSKLMTLGAPSLVTNRGGCIEGGFLFIYSGVCADNQAAAIFSAGRTVDRYDLSNGRYLSSVFLPPLGNEKAKQFIVRKDRIIALYEHCLAVFQMDGYKNATVRK